jgi:hypothetical protein
LPNLELINREREYKVKEILNRRRKESKIEFLVK